MTATTEAGTTTVPVWLESFDVDEIPDEMFLHAVSVDPFGWCGYAVPTATAAEFSRFISALARNDRNGTWTTEGIREGDGALVYEDECGKQVWSVVGVVDGSPVYALDGWSWAAPEALR
jgi:hypothetical protein